MIRILNVEPRGYSSEARRILSQIGKVVDRETNRRQLLKEISDADVLITRLSHNIDAEILERASRLKFVVCAATGLDHIDLACAESRGVTVLSLRDERELLRTISSTAEHTWGLLLALVRHLPHAFLSVRRGLWDRDRFRGRELQGKRLGIVGLGRIGTMVATYGRAFGMRVSAFDPYRKAWPSGVVRAKALDTLLRESDVLTLHVPLDSHTRNLIGRRELRLLPPAAILINTSRGQVVDEKALVESLENRCLAGAALDVVDMERSPGLRKRGQLLAYARKHENLIITPHIGGATVDAMTKCEMHLAKRLSEALG